MVMMLFWWRHKWENPVVLQFYRTVFTNAMSEYGSRPSSQLPPCAPLLWPSSLTKRDERFALIGLTYSPMLLARHLRREKENEVREGHKRRTGQFNKINSAERLSDQMPSTSTPRQTQRQKEGALIARGEAGL